MARRLKIIRAHRWRQLPYTIIQGLEGETTKAYSAIGALRKTPLRPGAKVKVWVPAIVHARRLRRTATKLAQGAK